MVWSLAGFVALVAGIMWGAKSGVQFSLSLIALKALPVLMLGGFTSIPGAIVGGLIIGNDYWANSLLLPFLIYAIAAIGLNILVGYCGQVSLGTGGFMAVGAYACYKLMTAMPDVSMFIHVLLAGLITAAVGVLFGLPSLRIKGFYLAVATLAAQFFLVWLFNRVSWFYNYSASGQINAPERDVFGIVITGPNAEAWATYAFCLIFTIASALVARNLTRGSVGRKWMAIRDMDIAAEIIGVNPLRAKLTAFAVSSFFIGISGALFFSIYLGAVEVGEVFGIHQILPRALYDHHRRLGQHLWQLCRGGLSGPAAGPAEGGRRGLAGLAHRYRGASCSCDRGSADRVFLIAEPHGIAQLWRVAKEKLRLWPFPH